MLRNWYQGYGMGYTTQQITHIVTIFIWNRVHTYFKSKTICIPI